MSLCTHVNAVKWNPYNGVVQCHECGQVWAPLAEVGDQYKDQVTLEQERLGGPQCEASYDACTKCIVFVIPEQEFLRSQAFEDLIAAQFPEDAIRRSMDQVLSGRPIMNFR